MSASDMMDNMLKAARARRDRCERIAVYARIVGLDTDWYRVNRNLPLWERWYSGNLATGYLIRQTGVKQIAPTQRKGR